MSKVYFDISMSLDGFITASGITADEPMGQDGERLHDWAFGSDPVNRDYLQRSVAQTGAVITGRVTYDASLPWWGADGPTGPARRPVFVVTHSEPSTSPEGGVYTFVTGRHRICPEAGGGRRRRPQRDDHGRSRDRSSVHCRWAGRRVVHPPDPGSARRWNFHV